VVVRSTLKTACEKGVRGRGVLCLHTMGERKSLFASSGRCGFYIASIDGLVVL